jgi:putative SOS response-associated peptidase YedK
MNWKNGRPKGTVKAVWQKTGMAIKKKKKKKTKSRPNTDMRYDGLDHWPEFDENKNTSRCKMEGCKNKCGIFCSKCKMHLCIIKN